MLLMCSSQLIKDIETNNQQIAITVNTYKEISGMR